MAKKLVDADFLAKLLEGSFEASMDRVDTLVADHPELFGGEDTEIRTIGTFDSHAIVANAEGEFFRVEHGVDDDGNFVLGEVERIAVPVKEASELGEDTRAEAHRAVEAMLTGDTAEADKRVGSLFTLVSSGVRLTAEGVEDDLVSLLSTDCGWVDAIRDNEEAIVGFVGAEANRELPRPRFENVFEMTEDEDRVRQVVRSRLRKLHESLTHMQGEIAEARRVDGGYTLRADGDADAEMATSDFVEFVDLYADDLDATAGLVEDALSVSEDGSVGSLARIHDGVAARVKEMGLAAAFAARFARRFEAPNVA
jgi:hypothetical protein